jgi:hypothetical protein
MKNNKKHLFIIDGYRIWAFNYDDALQHYYMIRSL